MMQSTIHNLKIDIRQAAITDVETLGKLFAGFRVFYGQENELDKSIEFLRERIRDNDSIVFIALDDTEIIGFTQLYPSFTSIGIEKIWILNDLFVMESYRQKGVAEKLINHALKFSKTTGRKKVVLSTAYTNKKAQSLYKKLGFNRKEFYNYEKLT